MLVRFGMLEVRPRIQGRKLWLLGSNHGRETSASPSWIPFQGTVKGVSSRANLVQGQELGNGPLNQGALGPVQPSKICPFHATQKRFPSGWYFKICEVGL